MTIPDGEYNPFALPPVEVGNSEFVSGGGADGTIDRVMSYLLDRLMLGEFNPIIDAPYDDAREIELAEVIAYACRAAGVPAVPPQRDTEFVAWCRTRGRTLSIAEALATKGAILYSGTTPAVSLGSRARVIVYDILIGPTVTSSVATGWTGATTIPTARGYR